MIIAEGITVEMTIEETIADVMVVATNEVVHVVTTAIDEAIFPVIATIDEMVIMVTMEATMEMADAETIPADHHSRTVMETVAMVEIDVTVMKTATAISQKTPKFTIFRGSSRL